MEPALDVANKNRAVRGERERSPSALKNLLSVNVGRRVKLVDQLHLRRIGDVEHTKAGVVVGDKSKIANYIKIVHIVLLVFVLADELGIAQVTDVPDGDIRVRMVGQFIAYKEKIAILGWPAAVMKADERCVYHR